MANYYNRSYQNRSRYAAGQFYVRPAEAEDDEYSEDYYMADREPGYYRNADYNFRQSLPRGYRGRYAESRIDDAAHTVDERKIFSDWY